MGKSNKHAGEHACGVHMKGTVHNYQDPFQKIRIALILVLLDVLVSFILSLHL